VFAGLALLCFLAAVVSLPFSLNASGALAVIAVAWIVCLIRIGGFRVRNR
jgi:hypothetical protein